MALVAGRTLVLQVAHPVVGAGVADHSAFQSEPWRRLWGTFQSVNRLVFLSEARAEAEGARLRKMHRAFTGVTANGAPYRALDPEAYLWVYATLWDGAVAMRRHFGRPLTTDQRQRFYDEWREVGRRLGISARLPDDAAAFSQHIDDVIDRELSHTSSVDDVLRALAHPPSPLPAWPFGPLWDTAVFPAGHIMHVATVGTLPPVLRERFGLRWSPAHELELQAVARAVRTAWPVLPPVVRRSFVAQNAQRRATALRRAAAASSTS